MSGDPHLKTPAWRAIRAHWIRLALGCHSPTCLYPGVPIVYAVDYQGPLALDVGHRVPRALARRRGWSVERIYSLDNTRPEHRTCNRTAGAATISTYRKLNGIEAMPMRPLECDEW